MSAPQRTRVAIVGGGISGLSTAFYSSRDDRGRDGEAAPQSSVMLFEAGGRFGGPIGTLHRDGFLLERGPDSFLARPSSVLDLLEALGLGDEVVSPRRCEPPLLIWARGALRALPPGMRLVVPGDVRAFLRSDLLSHRGKLRVLAEPLVPRRHALQPGHGVRDESMGAFFERRLGRELVETLVAPVLAGIYSGDAYALSLRSTFPRFLQMIEDHGSLLRAVRRMPDSGADGAPFRSLRAGMGSLVEHLLAALEASPGVELALQHHVTRLERAGSDWALRVESPHGDRTVLAEQVVLAVPAYVAARLLASHASDSAALLASVPYASTAGVYLAFDSAEGLPRSAGVMFPRDGSWRVRGLQLGANKFEGRAPVGGALVRAFFGGVGSSAIVDASEASLVAICREDLQRALGIERAPRFVEVMRYPQRAPQYTVGHAERMARALARLPARIHLVGSAYRGVGLPACVEGGRDVAAAIAAATAR